MDSDSFKSLVERKDAIESLLSTIDARLLVFGAIVLIGIAGETWYGVSSWLNNRKLRALQKQIDVERDRQSKEETARLESDTATANERAAVANGRAAQLEARQRPRMLDQPALAWLLQDAFKDVPKDGVVVDMYQCEGSDETGALAGILWASLHGAGFNAERPRRTLITGHSGLTVFIPPNGSQNTISSGEAIIAAFLKVGIQTERGTMTGDPDPIKIMIWVHGRF